MRLLTSVSLQIAAHAALSDVLSALVRRVHSTFERGSLCFKRFPVTDSIVGFSSADIPAPAESGINSTEIRRVDGLEYSKIQ